MPKNDYSAGMVSKPFWFIEFKKVMTLLDKGVDYDEIKRISLEENLFGVPKIYKTKKITAYLKYFLYYFHFEDDLQKNSYSFSTKASFLRLLFLVS